MRGNQPRRLAGPGEARGAAGWFRITSCSEKRVGRGAEVAAVGVPRGRDFSAPSTVPIVAAGWWRGLDSNQRRRAPTDLQSVPFSHSGTPPRGERRTIAMRPGCQRTCWRVSNSRFAGEGAGGGAKARSTTEARRHGGTEKAEAVAGIPTLLRVSVVDLCFLPPAQTCCLAPGECSIYVPHPMTPPPSSTA